MSYDAFNHAILLLIFGAFIVERSLAVFFETDIFIRKFGDRDHLKPTIALVYGVIFVWVADLNLVAIIQGKEDLSYQWSRDAYSIDLQNIFALIMSGAFIAGGSKASLKLFRDVMQIQSSREALRRQAVTPAPAKPVAASMEAAKGNTTARQMMFNLFDNSVIKPKP